jgi:hypothetical protein
MGVNPSQPCMLVVRPTDFVPRRGAGRIPPRVWLFPLAMVEQVAVG